MPATRVPGFGTTAIGGGRLGPIPGEIPAVPPVGLGDLRARRVSPRLSEIAVTLTTTSSRSGSRKLTSWIASLSGNDGSTTTAVDLLRDGQLPRLRSAESCR